MSESEHAQKRREESEYTADVLQENETLMHDRHKTFASFVLFAFDTSLPYQRRLPFEVLAHTGLMPSFNDLQEPLLLCVEMRTKMTDR